MLTDKALIRDGAELREKMMVLQENISQAEQQVQLWRAQLLSLQGALDYIGDNLKKEGKK